MRLTGPLHLSYCTSIHPGEHLDEVTAQLRAHVPRVKARSGCAGRFGLGLRLGAAAADALADPGALARFRGLLEELDAYVFTLNGFPYGCFAGRRVKEAVYRPDWREEARLAYADRLAAILAALLPEDLGYGSVSTVPVGFRVPPAELPRAAALLLRHVATLRALRARTRRRIVVALEPEPACALERTADAVRFFEEHLYARAALAEAGLTEADVRDHVGVCLDACHLAVMFEDPVEALAMLDAAAIPVAKVQLACGLRLDGGAAAPRAALGAFADDVYLHQVVARRDGELTAYLDLPEALAAGRGGEWRVHFHTPVDVDRMGPLATTQDVLARLLARLDGATEHLEVETYTWSVLPEAHRPTDVAASIGAELRWVRGRLGR